MPSDPLARSTPSRIYLDHNATTPLDPRVAAVVVDALAEGGNPSSVHAEGRRARDRVEAARREVAGLFGVTSWEVVFTGGGTEAVQLGIVGAARAARRAGRPARVVTSPLEHPAVEGAVDLLAAEGFEVARVPVDATGRIDPATVRAALGGGAALAAFALANHELGNVTDVAALAALARAAGALCFTDAVQAAGRIPVDAAALGVDLVAVSAHKLHGPPGVGALIVRGGVELDPIGGAGHQERGRRPGTENVPAIVGFGRAAELAREEDLARAPAIARRRDALEAACLGIPGARVHGDRAARTPGTLNVAWDGASGELIVAGLDLAGVAAATGAACSSGSVAPSRVILGLGLAPARAREAVRLSLGRATTDDEIARVAALLPEIVRRVVAAGPG